VKRAITIIGAVLALALAAIVDSGARAGTVSYVTFSTYTYLSSNTELARRTLSPLTAAQLPQILANAHETMSPQPVDLSHERFALFVPSTQPPRGYGLVVFVPPWDEAKVPGEWQEVLDEKGFLFVSAEHSGNNMTALGRRDPLAILEEQNMVKLYRIDPDRIFVSGFSGGARIAMRLALRYPDVFKGAILNSGSDAIGDTAIPLPPRDLFHQFQEKMRLIYLTGDRDVMNNALASARSMHEWCQFNVENRIVPSMGHELVSASLFAHALDELSAPAPPVDASQLAACRATTEGDLDAKLANAEQLIRSGRRDEAKSALTDIDVHYGGLAAPKILELQAEIAGK